jgi:hypothetical protein
LENRNEIAAVGCRSLEKPGLEGSEKEGTVAELWLA